MSGFGSQPFGSSPYGIGTPAVASGLGGKILRDESTGESRGSRRIDPRTQDYVVDANGRILGMSSTQQLVYLAVATTKGSSAMRSLGHELASIDRITSNFARRVDNTLRDAVRHIVDRGLIVIVSTTVELVRPGVAYAIVRWRDTASGEEEETLVGAQPPIAAAGNPAFGAP